MNLKAALTGGLFVYTVFSKPFIVFGGYNLTLNY
jgi:hypothetical protein